MHTPGMSRHVFISKNKQQVRNGMRVVGVWYTSQIKKQSHGRLVKVWEKSTVREKLCEQDLFLKESSSKDHVAARGVTGKSGTCLHKPSQQQQQPKGPIDGPEARKWTSGRRRLPYGRIWVTSTKAARRSKNRDFCTSGSTCWLSPAHQVFQHFKTNPPHRLTLRIKWIH